MLILFIMAISTLDCQEKYFAKFFSVLQNKCATLQEQIWICQTKPLYTRKEKKVQKETYTEMKNSSFKTSAKKITQIRKP